VRLALPATAQAGPGAAASAEQADDDNVVDAEFKEVKK
jgi:hypothetical protein